MEAAIREQLDRALKRRNEFTYLAIEEELGKIYAIGEDTPTVDDDEFHALISEAHADYESRGLVKAGE